jgi:hypothetical protein
MLRRSGGSWRTVEAEHWASHHLLAAPLSVMVVPSPLIPAMVMGRRGRTMGLPMAFRPMLAASAPDPACRHPNKAGIGWRSDGNIARRRRRRDNHCRLVIVAIARMGRDTARTGQCRYHQKGRKGGSRFHVHAPEESLWWITTNAVILSRITRSHAAQTTQIRNKHLSFVSKGKDAAFNAGDTERLRTGCSCKYPAAKSSARPKNDRPTPRPSRERGRGRGGIPAMATT